MKTITKVIIAFVLGLAIAIGCTVYSATFFSNSGTVKVQAPEVALSTPTIVTAPAQNEITTSFKDASQAISKEEARLRAIEARLTALEKKVK